MNKAFNRELNEIYAWLSKKETEIYNNSADEALDANREACKRIEAEASFKIKKLKEKYGINN